MSEVSRIIDALEREYDGDPWHGSPLVEILNGVSAAQACARPLASAHSIWELVLHVTSWKNEVRLRLSGSPAGEPKEGDWPEVGEPSEERWHDALERLRRAQRDLLADIQTLPEAKLFAPTNDTRDRAAGAGVTHYVLLLGSIQHDVYHAGQIALLKKGLTAVS